MLALDLDLVADTLTLFFLVCTGERKSSLACTGMPLYALSPPTLLLSLVYAEVVDAVDE